MRAVTRPLSEVSKGPVDLNDVAGADGFLIVRDGIGVAGQGEAARVDMDEAADRLADIEHDGPAGVPGAGPIAIGCLPFRPDAAASLVIPRRIVSKAADRSQWVTDIMADGEAPLARPLPGGRPCGTAEYATYRISPGVSVDHYMRAVSTTRDAVRNGEVLKAVIARDVTVTSDRPFDVHAILHRLKASFGSSYRYLVDGLIGASPELLVQVEGDTVRSHPLAGTAPRTGDPRHDAAIAEALVESTKNQVEHRVVIDVVHDTLLPWCSYLDWQPEPSIVTVANVQHLGTPIEGRLSRPSPDVAVLVRALSPTPALGGHPRREALALIDRVEGFDRGRYGGAVGWIDAAGNGTWAVAIRGAELSADRCEARLVAGGGIVAESDPIAELAETQAKFQAMLSALIRA
ncbi:MAG: isochorismate synthase [Actinomycetota bacterium]|nr:isochorismate synthase [Actinomycetota bacterium]